MGGAATRHVGLPTGLRLLDRHTCSRRASFVPHPEDGIGVQAVADPSPCPLLVERAGLNHEVSPKAARGASLSRPRDRGELANRPTRARLLARILLHAGHPLRGVAPDGGQPQIGPRPKGRLPIWNLDSYSARLR